MSLRKFRDSFRDYVPEWLQDRPGLNVGYRFLFMKASGAQLERITALIDAGTIRPVMDKVFPFAETKEALAYIETGRAKGKVVVMRTRLSVAVPRVWALPFPSTMSSSPARSQGTKAAIGETCLDQVDA